MPSVTNLNDFTQSPVPPLPLQRAPSLAAPAHAQGSETPQAPPMTMRHASPSPAAKSPVQRVMPAKIRAPPPLSERGRGQKLPNESSQSQLQMQLQAKAQAQIQAYQALVQAQAQAYALSQIQPQVQALTKAQSQVHMAPAQSSSQPAAYGQMQVVVPPEAEQAGKVVVPQSMLARQSTSKSSLVPTAWQQSPVQQPTSVSDEAHMQMQRQLQEQMVAQMWTQAVVPSRGRPQTLVRQQSWARTAPSRPVTSPQASSPPPGSMEEYLGRTGVERLSVSRAPEAPVQEPLSARVIEIPAPAPAPKPAPLPSVEANAQADQELLPGVVVTIDGKQFEIMQPLGMGSYGMVWSAMSEESSREVAVKEILCRSQGELSIAHFEGSLLHKLGHMEIGACRNGRLPALVAQETHPMSQGKSWRVRLAMSRIPGVPLMILLEQHRENKKLVEATPPGEIPEFFPERPLPPGKSPLDVLLWKLYDPCLFTKELIVQILPTLERIAAVAFHRDINPRNILVDRDEDKPGAPNYGLVDFGMAVDAGQWRADSRGNWNTLEVGGDCRYWPVSAWVMFLHGPQELTPGAPWRIEYQTQLDIHALGITALQVFVELLPTWQDLPPGDADDDDGCLRGEDSLLARLKYLNSAWAQYWEDAMDFWSCLIDCFTNAGDWNALKRACINHGVQEAITRDLMDLRSALAEASLACEVAASSNASPATIEAAKELRAVFGAITALISDGESTHFPSWRHIHSILGLPASMEDLASARASNGSTARLGFGSGYSTNKLSSTTLASGRSCYNMISPTTTPGPLISRGVSSAANDPSVPKSSPTTARRQASVIRDSAPSGSSTSRMVSVVSNASPVTSPRRPATVIVDTAGRQHTVASQHSAMRGEPFSARRSGNNIAGSPAGPLRSSRAGGALQREPSVPAEDMQMQSHRSRSALVPSSPSNTASMTEFAPPRRSADQTASSVNMLTIAGTPPQFKSGAVVRATSAAPEFLSSPLYAGNAVRRGTSVVASTSGLQESSSSTLVRGAASGHAASQPGFLTSRGDVPVTVMTAAASPPEYSPGQVIRGSSVVASNQTSIKRSQSPVGRGSSVVVESASRGPSVVTAAAPANRAGASIALDTSGPPTARRARSVVAEAAPSGPSPSQVARGVMAPAPSVLSARQWAPIVSSSQGFATSGSDIADQASAVTGNFSGASVIIGAAPSGFGSGDSCATALPAAQAAVFPAQVLTTSFAQS